MSMYDYFNNYGSYNKTAHSKNEPTSNYSDVGQTTSSNSLNRFTTVDNREVDILEVPFLGEEQHLHLSDLKQTLPKLEKGFLLLTHKGAPTNLKDIPAHNNLLKNLSPCTPTLFLDINLYTEIMYILKRALPITGNEAAGFFTYRKLLENRPYYIASSQFLVGQEASSGAVELDGIEISKYIEFYNEKYNQTFKEQLEAAGLSYTGNIWDYIGHWHSHGTMGTFWSGTDKNQQEQPNQLGFNADGRFYLVFNKEGSIKASYVQYKPVFHRVEDINLGLYVGTPYKFNKERRDEIDKLIDSLIIKKSAYTYNYRGNK